MVKLTLQIFGKEVSVALGEPAKPPNDHKCPTREEDFEKWKAQTSSGHASFGFAPRKQDFVNSSYRGGNPGGRWTQ